MAGEFDESKHPRAKDGKFGSDHGSRATESIKDRAFIGEHRERLLEGAGSADRKFPREEHGSDAHHAARASAMHAEAMRIHAEKDLGASPHADRLRPVFDDNVALHGHELAADRVNTEQAAIDNEAAALKAGHITEPSTKLTDKFEATREVVDKEHEQIKDELHTSGQDAVSRVAALRELDDEDNGIGGTEIDHEDLAATIGEATGKDVDLPDLERPPALEAPDEDEIGGDPGDEEDEVGEAPTRDDFDDGDEGDEAFKEDVEAFADAKKEHERRKQAFEASKKEHEEKTKAYEAEVARRQAEYQSKAAAAQDALEAHHEREIEALDTLTKLEKEHDKAFEAADSHLADLEDGDGLVNDKAFEDAERDEDDEDTFSDPEVEAAHGRAHNASETRLAHLRTQLERRRLDVSGTSEHLKESIKTTRDAIKQLAKITRRAPKLSGKKPSKTKKSGNRPGAGGGASLADMARYKLKLSKLDFISLVDRPAQETATIRLIKRAGAEQVQARAVARVVKIGDGASPLVHCWAFTCTGEDGKPYHDLQDDAVDEDFIKAAEEFLRAGAAVDEMHDGQQTSRVAFAYPMDSDVARGMYGKAIGDQIKTSGLMVAIRPSPAALVKIRSGEYTGVSIAGLGTRELAKGYKPGGKGDKGKKPKWRRKVGKIAVLTSVELGHQHTINLDDPACGWSGSLSTSYQTSEGAEDGHCHAWVYDATTGAITIALDSGHAHTTEAVVPADVLAAALAEEAEPPHKDEACEAPCEGGEAGSPTVVAISLRAPGGVSTPAGGVPTVKSQEQAMADAKDDKIAELEKRNARLEKLFALTDAERAHHATLKGTDADEFVGKSVSQRQAVLTEIEKANEVVYTSSADGTVYRKSHDPQFVAMAKRLDQHAVELAVAKTATETAAIEKRAIADLSHFAKALPVHVAMVRAIDGIPDEAVRKEALESLKAANVAMVALGKSTGVNPGTDPVDGNPKAAFDAERTTFAKAKFKTETPTDLQIKQATGEFIKTAKGAELYADLNNRAQA